MQQTASTPQQHAAGIGRLVDSMKHKLAVNSHKGHWENMTSGHILGLLKGEVRELEEAVLSNGFTYDDILMECADVANFAMMLHDNIVRSAGKEEDLGLEHLAGTTPFAKENKVAFQPKTFQQALDWAYEGMRSIMLEKRTLRGPGNITAQGLVGVVNRMGEDKMARVKTEIERRQAREVMKRHGVPQHLIDQYVPHIESSESLEDDLFDIGNYAAIAILVERGWWDLPLEGNA